ncbi:MAG TPA: PQQ-binding-like beta-propeller repeat protein [Gemmataceae bacterium]|nr:PQQ-binding-like beta-propeller repeat protein [Gemmataceae bacterium]
MNKILAAAGVLLWTGAALASNDPTRIWSNPAVPSREALDRLNLDIAWAVYVPMDGKRDGFASIQLDHNQVIAQTRSGLIAVLDAANGGRTLWRSRPGRAYEAVLPPAINSWGVYVNDSGGVYGLDRATGQLQWRYELRVALSAPLSVDEQQIYIENVEARLIAARLPAPPKPAAPPPTANPGTPAGTGTDQTPALPSPGATLSIEDVRPLIAFDYDTGKRVETKAVLSKAAVFLAIPDGSYLAVPKKGDEHLDNKSLYDYSGDSRFSAPPGHTDTMAYLSTSDSHLYAVVIDSGEIQWRYFPGRPIMSRPVAVDVTEGGKADKDLYITALEKGMARLDRQTGLPIWKIGHGDNNPEADRFMAVNPKFVYAADDRGNMLILDRKNGAVLSRYDVRDYVFPISNAESDRIYLAANNGLIVCLHDKAYPQALSYRVKSLEERAKELADKLARPISDAGGEMMTLAEYVDKIKKTYGVEMFISDPAFTELMLPPPEKQMIQTPKADSQPLGDVIKSVLDQAKAEYIQREDEDTLIIKPAKMK